MVVVVLRYGSSLNMPDWLIIFGAKYLIAVVVIITGIFWLQRNKEDKKIMAVRGLITMPLSLLSARLISMLYYNPRPFVVENIAPLIQHASDNGFPSDHTLLAAACAALIASYDKKLGGVLYLLTILIGASRVAAKVHHPLDIFGSIVIASAVIWLTVLIQKKLAKKHLQTPTDHV